MNVEHQIALTLGDPERVKALVPLSRGQRISEPIRNSAPNVRLEVAQKSAPLVQEELQCVGVAAAQERTSRKRGEPMPPESTANVEITSEAYDEAVEFNQILTDEYDRMEVRLAVHFMEGTEEEKALAADTIGQQRKRIAELEVEVKAVRTSRDMLQNENAQLIGQCLSYRKQLSRRGEAK